MNKSVLLVLLILLFGTTVWAEETSLLLNPPQGGQVQSIDLVVSATVNGPLKEALDLRTAKLYLGDRDVTGLCLRTDGYLSFRPMNPLPPGPVDAKLQFANGVVRQWSFKVVPTELIESVTHNAKEALGEWGRMVHSAPLLGAKEFQRIKQST